MEELTSDQQNLFAQVFNFTPIGIVLISLDGQWIDVNPAACQSPDTKETSL